MNEVDLKVHVLAVDLVLGRRVHVELRNLELRHRELVEVKLHLPISYSNLDRVVGLLDSGISVVGVRLWLQLDVEAPSLFGFIREVDRGLFPASVTELVASK